MKNVEDLGSLRLVPIEIEGQLDRRVISMREILSLKPGQTIRLNRSAGDNIDILAGGATIGFGEIAVLENQICLRLTDLREES
ncbi:MAG TPA: FliM/FliN family flagellar motor C-terminal domain-containing protein [Bryobacteraceae bacterium]|nr:FliM/FliN family flagellar motor C-terminal domain-containing protein [Bryobacteraceae bacterium]